MDIKATPQYKRFRRIGLPLTVGGIFIGLFALIGLYAANVRGKLPDPFTPYDPATFGIPEILAGYRILVVQSADNTHCTKPGTKNVTIQAVDPSPDNPMVARDGGDIIFELKKIDPNTEWGLTYVMPVPFERAQFLSIIENYNRGMENGCISFNRPIVSLTPDPFAPYAPATYGLPEIVTGYRIVAVHSSDNTPCMPANRILLTIQAVDPSPDNPMVDRNGGDIIFEVKKLHPDLDWQLEYIMPVPFDREQFIASMQQWIKEGCVTLGGPEFTVVPSATP